MKLNFNIDIDEAFGDGFEQYIQNVYYESDTGYKEVETDEFPKLQELVYEKAFESLISEAKSNIKEKMTDSSEDAISKFDQEVQVQLDKSIQEFTDKTMNEFLERKVIAVKPNGYSHEIKEIPLTTYIENKIDNKIFEKKFGADGRTSNYDAKFSGFDIVSKKIIENMVSKKFDEIIKNQKQDIQFVLTKIIREKLSEQYVNEDSIKKILEETLAEANK